MVFKRSIIKKSLFVLPACLALISCGKRVTSSGGDDDIVIIPELNKNVSLELNFEGDTTSKSKSYMFVQDAQVEIPAQIYLKSGSPLNYAVNIYFNTNHNPEQRDKADEFYCSYKNVKIIGDEANKYYHEFVGCFGEVEGTIKNLGYEVGQQKFQERWRYIRFDLISGFSYEKSEIFTELEIKYR